MKRNELRHDYAWAKGLAWFLAGAVGVSLWWSMGASRMENRMPMVLSPPQLELPGAEGSSNFNQKSQVIGPVAKAARLSAETYWVETTGDGMILMPKPMEIAAGLSKESALKLAFEDLLSGPTDIGFSAIPTGTKLLDLETRPAGVYVNLSREFASGGGSASMIERVGQVIFTASSVDPNESVLLAVEGQLISPEYPLGGEGLVLDQPVSRSQYIAQYPL